MEKNILPIQNKFYESLKQKELMYKEILEKTSEEENNDSIEFNYPFFIFHEIQNREKEKKRKNESKKEILETINLLNQKEEEDEESEAEYNYKANNNRYHKTSSIQLIKTNKNYDIIYEY